MSARAFPAVSIALLASAALNGCASAPAPGPSREVPAPKATGSVAPEPLEEPPPKVLALRDAVDRALRRNLDLVAPDLAVESARGRLDAAATRLNPRLALRPQWGFEANKGTGFEGHVRADMELGYTIETGGRRGERIETATRELEASEADSRAVRAAVRIEAERAFDSAVEAELRATLCESQDSSLEVRLAASERRVASGDLAPTTLSTVRKERADGAVALAQARTERAQARVRLARAIGFEPASALDATKLLGDPLEIDIAALSTEALVARAIADRPDLVAKRAQVVSRDARIALEEAKAYPNVDVSAMYGRDVDGDTAGVGIGFDLPFFDRNAGAIRDAVAQRNAAAADLAAREATVRADVESAARGLVTAREALVHFRERVLPALVASDAAAQRKLSSGEFGPNERADAALDLARGRIAELDLAQAARRARRDLEAAIGGPIESEGAP